MRASKLSRKNITKRSSTDEKGAGKLYGVRQVKDGVVFSAYYPTASTVQVAGDFNNWQPQQTPMRKVGGVWKVKLPLSAGSYRYRLVVDGQWQQDPYNEMTEINPFGEYNSIIEVK